MSKTHPQQRGPRQSPRTFCHELLPLQPRPRKNFLQCVDVLVRDVSSCMMVSGYVVSESVEMCSIAPPFAATHDDRRSSQSRSSRSRSCQERTAAQARAASDLKEIRLRTVCEHLPLDRVPGARVKRFQVRAAKRFGCVWVVLTAELLLAWLVRCRSVPLDNQLPCCKM